MAHGPITAGTFVAGNNNAQTPTNPTHVSGDTLLCIAVIRSTTATLSVSGAGWGAADGITNPISLNGARLYIFQNEADSGSEANPTVTPSGGANGVTVTAGVLRLEGRDPDANFSIGTVSSNAVSTSIIAFGQNSPTIEYGNAILAIGHILDDYTTAPGALTGHAAGVSFSEIVNFETTQGSDQTVTVDYGVHHANGSYTAGTGATKRNGSWTSAVNSGVYLESVGEHPSSVNFRFYEPGTEDGATAIAAQNTHVSRDDADQARLSLRMSLQNSTGAVLSGTPAIRLQYSKNGAAYTDVGSATSDVRGYDDPSLTDNGTTTSRLSGSGTFEAGQICEDGLANGADLGSGNFTEYLFALELVSADVAVGDTLEFRLVINGQAITNINGAPKITVTAVAQGGPVGRADEADTALALGVARPTGLATETDAALALGVARPAGLATSAETALALAGLQARSVGLATSTEMALALASPLAVGLATSTETALALGAARPAGLAVETDVSLALSAVQAKGTGLAVTADAALGLQAVQKRDVGLAAEAASALALAARQVRPVGLALETATALALSPGAALGVGLAIEVDEALSLGAVQIGGIGLAASSDLALGLPGAQIRDVGLAISTETALALLAGFEQPPTPPNRQLGVGGGRKEDRVTVVGSGADRSVSIGGGGVRGL